MFELFIFNNFVTFSCDFSHSTLVRILQDTGSSQSLLSANSFPCSGESSSATSVLNQGVDFCGFTTVALPGVDLSSDLVTGHATVGVRSSLLFECVHFF